MTDALTYDAAVRAACQTALGAGATSWREILHATQGAEPSVVLAALAHLHSMGDLDDARWTQLQTRARTPGPAVPATATPVPHPLDYVWRFDDDTVRKLLDRVMAASAPGDNIAYLGTPMLHAAAVRADATRHHLLLDNDSRVVADANAAKAGTGLCVDLLGPTIPELAATVAIADPPWYPEEGSVFVNAAASLVRECGRVMVAFGSGLTRPSARDDLAAVIAAAYDDGLALSSVEDGACGYLTPPFERASLELAGLAGMPLDWRRGQLLEFARVGTEPPSRRTLRTEQWVRINVDEIPLRVRPKAPVHGTGLLSSVVDGDQLISVSRREVARDRVALWTSRNRVYGSSDPSRLATILERLPSMGVETLAGEERAVAARIARIVALERYEHGLTAEAPEL